MPLGFLFALAGRLVAPGFRGRDREIRDRAAVLRAANVGIAAQVADF
jgi:hypothetical protein